MQLLVKITARGNSIFQKKGIKSLQENIENAYNHLQSIEEQVQFEVQEKVREGNIRHPNCYIRKRIKELIADRRLLTNQSSSQGPKLKSIIIPNLQEKLIEFIVSHGGLMKDKRNCPVDAVLLGPRLSLDKITDYAQQLANEANTTISKSMVRSVIQSGGVQHLKPVNDLMQFHFDSYFCNSNDKSLQSFAKLNSDIVNLLSIDRKGNFYIETTQNKSHGVWQLRDQRCHVPDHSQPLATSPKLSALSVGLLSSTLDERKESQDVELKSFYFDMGINRHTEQQEFKPFVVVHRDDIDTQKECGINNMNAIAYVLLRYPEVFGHNGMKPILVCEVDGGHGVSNKDEEALFSFVLLFIAFNLSMLIVYRHAPGQSALNVSERINGAQSKALSGCPIYLNLKDLHKASVDEIDEAMTAAQVEYIKRVHGQPCKKSTITAMVPPSYDSCMFSFSDVKSFLASGKPKIPLFEEAKRIINDPLLLKQSEYCLQIKSPTLYLRN